MGLRDALDQIASETETRVDALFNRRRSGEVDEETFVNLSARTIDFANRRAVVTADVSVSAQVATQTGRPVRPAGIRPFSDQLRLRGAVRTTAQPADGDGREDPETRRMRVRRLARSEPYSTAQDTLPEAMKAQGARGWVRVTNPDACKLCVKWADGKVRPLTTTMIRHPGCTCLQRPVTEAPREAEAKAQVSVVPGPFIARQITTTAAQRVALAALGGGAAVGYVYRPRRPAPGPTIFERINQFERALAPYGVGLAKGTYMVHGSGLLDALNLRAAADLDVIAHPDLYEQIKHVPGWRPLMAGVEKDVEILSNPKLNMQIAKAIEFEPEQQVLPLPELHDVNVRRPLPKRRQITTDDLLANTVTIRGREFIRPEVLHEMKSAAIREGAKVKKNIRDLNLLEGKLTWAEDVRRFGDLLNRSRITSAREMAALARHPVLGRGRQERAARLGGLFRARSARRPLQTIATVSERRALQRYGRGSFELNDALRSGAQLTAEQLRQVELIDAALAKQHTPYRVKVYRGLRMTRQEALEMYRPHVGGAPIREKSYLSTGLREAVARKYGQSGVYLEIDVPAGTNGYYAPYRALSPQATPDKILQAFGEDELLLPRGVPYRIVEVVDRPDGTVLIRAEIMPTAMPSPPLPGMEIRAMVRGEPPARISPLEPEAVKKAKTGRRGEGPAMSVDLVPDNAVGKVVERQVAVPGFEHLAGRTDRDALDEIIDLMADNIGHWAEQSMLISRDATDLHARWYPIGHEFINDIVDPRRNVDRNGGYAATAALSPGTEWPDNVAWAKRIIEAIDDDVEVQADWIEALYQTERRLGRPLGSATRIQRRRHLIGKKLSEIRNNEEAALALRGWSETPAGQVTQLGNRPGFGVAGDLTATQSTLNLTKAVSVLRDSSLENIDKELGGQKVRSFYMNLANPYEAVELNVAVDSHHYGIANGYPWTQGSEFLTTKAGSRNLSERPAMGTIGLYGTYVLVVEATRRATVIFNTRWGTNYLPNQIQSIVWEMHRALFPPASRRPTRGQAKTPFMEAAEGIRSARARGLITRQEEHRRFEELRLAFDHPNAVEIQAWFLADLAGIERPTLEDMREAAAQWLRRQGGTP